jgi:type IV fimbrial biogenesis protein FimT
VICKSSDAIFCTTTGGWEQGWIVFLDGNNDALRQPEESLISLHPISTASLQIRGNGNVSKYVSFTATGSTHLISHAFQAGTVTACLPGDLSVAAWKIVINSTGRMRMVKDIHAQCPA